MSNQPDPLAALRALREATSDLTQRAALDAAITALENQRQSPLVDLSSSQAGDVKVGDTAGRDLRTGTVAVGGQARVYGPTVGINLGQIIYGRDPREDERRRLVWYLDALAGSLRRLPLRGLDADLAEGRGVDLGRVYVMLATEGEALLAQGRGSELRSFFADNELRQPAPEHDPDLALPTVAWRGIRKAGEGIYEHERLVQAGTPNDPAVQLRRSLLVTEAVQQHQRLALLGDPGSGKSTFLRHLAWTLAQRGLDERGPATALFGWDDARRLLPILLPLRRLAGLLGAGANERAVYTALRDEIRDYGVQAPDDLLTDALVRGTTILLFDGLDEVPQAAAGPLADRLTTLRAVREFTDRYPRALAAITCRTRAFTDDLRACLGWSVESLASFTLGQVRHFVPAWYGELVVAGQLEAAQAERLSTALIETVVSREQLRRMAGTPLLLTMMALLLYKRGTLPRDRPRLYEEILELLLGQWDKVRDGQSLAEVIGRPDWTSDRLRPLLDRLSFQAHAAARSTDGRGRLGRGELYTALIDFFRDAQVPAPGDTALHCLDYFEQRSGLLTPDGPDSYVFAHLTLQEHCAGRHMLLSRDAVNQVLARRGEDRWREPILLGLGVVQASNPYLVEKVLRTLLDRREAGAAKQTVRWCRDVILAAEIGQDRDWTYLRDQQVDVGALQDALRTGLAALLGERHQPLPTAERVRAGFLLGGLGDPRVPVTNEAWQHELAQAQAGAPEGYFSRVEAKTYIIGSKDDPDASEEEQPQYAVTFAQPFFIARYPITNAQWQAWVEQEGRRPSYAANDDDLNRLNQPVVAITWHMANAFCAWLSKQLSSALPKGSMLRLPTEQEWEAAARGGDARRYPWGDGWREDHAATDEDHETRGWRWSVPVGCYPAGAAPCGALDMAGNVWEWTASVWQSYPGAEKVFTDEARRVLRGGTAWSGNRTNVRCGARVRDLLGLVSSYVGFRVVLAPALAQMS